MIFQKNKLTTIFNKYFILISFFALFLIYLPIISNGPTVNPDAQIIFNNLEQIKSFKDYFFHLIKFETIDFQPIRDLSLYLDLSFFNTFGINLTIIQNMIIWLLSCLTIRKILILLFPKMKSFEFNLLTLNFMTYPIFANVISWGIARKHLLAFLFILLASYQFMRDHRKRSHLFFLLSTLSQPIHLLWPIWAFIYSVFLKRHSIKETIRSLTPSFLILVFMGIINTFYYKTSITFINHYLSNTQDIFNFSDRLLAMGHYFFQIIFPYQLSLYYTLGDYQVLIGILLLFIFLLQLLKFKDRENLTWLILGMLSLSVVLNSPKQLYDTYLLAPFFSIFLYLIFNLKNHGIHLRPYLLIITFLFFSFRTFKESSYWKSPVKLAQKSFLTRKSCHNAKSYLRISYENSVVELDRRLRNYLMEFDCLKGSKSSIYKASLRASLVGYIMYYEDTIPIKKRIKHLQELSEKYIVAELCLIGLLIKEKRYKAADQQITLIIDKLKRDQLTLYSNYHPITAKVTRKYCLKKNWNECLQFTQFFSKKKIKLYL